MNKKLTLPVYFIAALLSLSLGPNFSSARSSAPPAAATPQPDTQMPGKELWDLTESKLFNGQVHKISLRLNQAVWNRLHEDEKNNGCRNLGTAKWAHLRDFTFNDIALKDVAIKVRGNSSRCIPRLQFAISFNKAKGIYTRQGSEDWTEVKYSEPVGEAIETRT